MNSSIRSFSQALIDLSEYKILEKIGAGSFGKVYLMETPDQQNTYAVKFMGGGFANYRSKLVFIREVETQLACSDAKVTTFVGYHLPDSNVQIKKLRNPALIMEFMPNGCLIDYLKNDDKKEILTSTIKSKLLFGIAVRIRHMHRKNVIHRDLKPDNILLDKDFNPRISDFGLARFITENEEGIMTGDLGTMTYMAPEVMGTNDYNKKADVYSFAMLAYHLMTGDEPFADVNYINLMAMVSSGERPTIPDSIPEFLAVLIEQCWSNDPNERPDFEKIVEVMTSFDCVLDGTDMEEYNIYRKDSLEEFNIDFIAI